MLEKSNSQKNQQLPRHVAMIMDGNGRWAKLHHKSRFAGHRAGAKAISKVIKASIKNNIEVLSLFAFSSENWGRPPDEVKSLMELFLNALKNQVSELHQNNIQLRIIGDTSRFSKDIQEYIAKSEKLTKNNTGLKLVIAVNYGGKWDIIQAVRRVAKDVKAGIYQAEEIDEQLFSNYLSLSDIPYPDLFIRTSGECRISNFFIWQLAYSELFFSDILWPDFDEKAFEEALDDYAGRERRFGLISTKEE